MRIQIIFLTGLFCLASPLFGKGKALNDPQICLEQLAQACPHNQGAEAILACLWLLPKETSPFCHTYLSLSFDWLLHYGAAAHHQCDMNVFDSQILGSHKKSPKDLPIICKTLLNQVEKSFQISQAELQRLLNWSDYLKQTRNWGNEIKHKFLHSSSENAKE